MFIGLKEVASIQQQGILNPVSPCEIYGMGTSIKSEIQVLVFVLLLDMCGSESTSLVCSYVKWDFCTGDLKPLASEMQMYNHCTHFCAFQSQGGYRPEIGGKRLINHLIQAHASRQSHW